MGGINLISDRIPGTQQTTPKGCSQGLLSLHDNEEISPAGGPTAQATSMGKGQYWLDYSAERGARWVIYGNWAHLTTVVLCGRRRRGKAVRRLLVLRRGLRRRLTVAAGRRRHVVRRRRLRVLRRSGWHAVCLQAISLLSAGAKLHNDVGFEMNVVNPGNQSLVSVTIHTEVHSPGVWHSGIAAVRCNL